jgi:ribosomal protein L12E/L44/L45/RPP1/RPP2
MSTYDGWHFAGSALRDGSPLPRKGETLHMDGGPVLCKRGYHASARALDALSYAPRAMVARVSLSGTVVEQGDKACATDRTMLSDYVDVTRELHLFACDCAQGALQAERKAGREPDPWSWRAVEVKRLWLDGKATDEDLAAARAAAGAAAWAAARDASRAAARDAARDAAWEAQVDHLIEMLTEMAR